MNKKRIINKKVSSRILGQISQYKERKVTTMKKIIEQLISRKTKQKNILAAQLPSRLAAFTLAEVLTVLGLLGVIAALTLPFLIQEFNKNKWAVTYQRSFAETFNVLTKIEFAISIPFTSSAAPAASLPVRGSRTPILTILSSSSFGSINAALKLLNVVHPHSDMVITMTSTKHNIFLNLNLFAQGYVAKRYF